MARTTPTLVGDIVEVDDTISLVPFIDTASELVTEVCGSAGYSDTRLELIERWLSAHFYKIRDQAVANEKAGPAQTAYQYQVGLGLAQTKEGQQAMILDTKGGLAALSKRTEQGNSQHPGITWLGSSC